MMSTNKACRLQEQREQYKMMRAAEIQEQHANRHERERERGMHKKQQERPLLRERRLKREGENNKGMQYRHTLAKTQFTILKS